MGEALAGRGFCIADEPLRSATASAGPEDCHPDGPDGHHDLSQVELAAMAYEQMS